MVNTLGNTRSLKMQYDYRCPDCNGEITIERSIHEDPREPSCFDCHIPMIRKWDTPAITFKGKGFYSTDK
jgi:predicted nucleic acid-binding Zn ribbon protein